MRLLLTSGNISIFQVGKILVLDKGRLWSDLGLIKTFFSLFTLVAECGRQIIIEASWSAFRLNWVITQFVHCSWSDILFNYFPLQTVSIVGTRWSDSELKREYLLILFSNAVGPYCEDRMRGKPRPRLKTSCCCTALHTSGYSTYCTDLHTWIYFTYWSWWIKIYWSADVLPGRHFVRMAFWRVARPPWTFCQDRLGDYLGTHWGLFGHNFGTTWTPLGDYLGTTWGLLGHHFGATWAQLGHTLSI